jgi:predicted 3-demethylubiquinone-9 3-methyltransferase (glyoxalase superfamily)
MLKISPILWFDDQAEEAANFYVSLFIDSAILGVSRYGRARHVRLGASCW